MTKGKLDITAFPLAYAGSKHPEFNLTLMLGLVKNHDHAIRLNSSPFMQKIKDIMDSAGVMVSADTWLAGGFVSKKACVLEVVSDGSQALTEDNIIEPLQGQLARFKQPKRVYLKVLRQALEAIL